MKTIRQRAFTLVELLVVLSIIAILLALLLPTLKSARIRAKGVQCINNQRQLSVCLAGFLSDHNNYYPYIYPECPMTLAVGATNCPAFGNQLWRASFAGGSCSLGNWWQVLMPYGGFTSPSNPGYAKVVQCPMNPYGWTYPGNGGNVSCTYGMNEDFFPVTWRCGGASSCGASCASPTSGANPTSPQGWSRRARASDVAHASALLFMGELPVDGNNGPQRLNPWSAANPTRYAYGLPFANAGFIEAYMVTNVFWAGAPSAPYAPATWEWLRPDCTANVAAFHNLNMNGMYCDGHVAPIAKSTLIEFSCQFFAPSGGHAQLAGGIANDTPGGVFWGDGRPVPNVDSNYAVGGFWSGNQFPGYDFQ